MFRLSVAGLATASVLMMTGSVYALEAVVQSDVGSGSAVAGSIGAVNSRADALQGNMNAANLVIQQLQNRVSELEKLVSATMLVVTKVADGTDGVPGFNGLPGSNGKGGSGGSGIPGLDGVSAKTGKGSWCGALLWAPLGALSGTDPLDYFLVPYSFKGTTQYMEYKVYVSEPCMGQPLVINHARHCPEGYSFRDVGRDSNSIYSAPNSIDGNVATGPGTGNYTSTMTQSTCMKD